MYAYKSNKLKYSYLYKLKIDLQNLIDKVLRYNINNRFCDKKSDMMD